MKRLVLFIAALCLAALSMTGISLAAEASDSQYRTIYSFDGNISEKDLHFITNSVPFGRPGMVVAQTAKFIPPKSGWKIKAVDVLAYDGFNGTPISVPEDRVIVLEVRDKDHNLIYRFADSVLPYSNYVFNVTHPRSMMIELPSVPVSDEFYICFFDRAVVGVAYEFLNQTNGNSFFYNEAGDELFPATLPVAENQTSPINWIMSVTGS